MDKRIDNVPASDRDGCLYPQEQTSSTSPTCETTSSKSTHKWAPAALRLLSSGIGHPMEELSETDGPISLHPVTFSHCRRRPTGIRESGAACSRRS